MSDAGLLVCHAVYPERPEKELIDPFQLYVEDWAVQLTIRIARGEDAWEELSVAPLAVSRWYDDGPWSRFCGDSASA